MSWMQKLYQTYEYVQSKNLGDENLALPFHMSKVVHFKVVLDETGRLVRAERLAYAKKVPIQVTEKSVKRTGDIIAPYALHDSLKYIAKTAENYLTPEYLSKVAKTKIGKPGGIKWSKFLSADKQGKQTFAGKEKEQYRHCFESYAQQLADWIEISKLYEIQIVLNYVENGSLIEDLLEKEIFSFEDNILLCGNEDPFTFTIVWAVERRNEVHVDLWSNPKVIHQWIQYQESQNTQNDGQDLCYITGMRDYALEAYPKISGNAKLVSANDIKGFTYLGRFLTDRQAVFLGKNVSQKAFNMLKWLIEQPESIRNGSKKEQIILAWAINGKPMPSPLEDTYHYLLEDDDWDDHVVTQESEILDSENDLDHSANLGKSAAAIIKQKLYGYQIELEGQQQISLLMLDAASDGRMALTYYQEFLPDDYFANLDAWVDDFSWHQHHEYAVKNGKKADERTIWRYMPPPPNKIFETAYCKSTDNESNERKNKSQSQNKDEKIKKQLYARLLPVIAGGRAVPIPYDLVQQSFQAACNPQGYKHSEWQKNIGVACALYKGWRIRHHEPSQRRTYNMALDKENRSRDYLYGRLLAIAESLERTALDMANEIRATNAERYMQNFARNPFYTWQQLEKNLKPYKERLRKDYPVGINGKFILKSPLGFLRNRENEINQIVSLLDELKQSGCDLNKPLEPEFLLGYHSQIMAYRNTTSTQSEQD